MPRIVGNTQRKGTEVAGQYDTGFIERNKEQLLGYPTLPEDRRESVAVAVAIAAARMEQSSAVTDARTSALGSLLSPWVSTHRGRTLR